jgi:hypothetical protein
MKEWREDEGLIERNGGPPGEGGGDLNFTKGWGGTEVRE